MVRRFFWFSVFISLLLSIGTYFSCRPVSRLVVRRTLEVEVGRILSKLRPCRDIDQVIEQLSQYHYVTLCDAKGDVLYASKKPFIAKRKQVFRRTCVSGKRGDLLFAGKSFEMDKKKYALYLSGDSKLLDAILGHMHIYGTALAIIILVAFSILLTFCLQWALKPIEAMMLRFKRSSVRAACEMAMAQMDNHEEKLLFEKQEKLAVLESLDEGVVVLGNQMRITFINLKAISLLKVGVMQPVGQLFTDVVSTPLAKEALEVAKASLKNQVVEKRGFSDQDENYFAMTAAPIARRGAALIVQDRSSDHKIYAMGKNFVANASHELRTPITIIKGFAETLLEMPQISSSMLSDISEKIVRSCERMNNLVKSLLVLADLENENKNEMQPCDLCSLVESCSLTVLGVHPNVGIEQLQNQDEAVIWGNPGLLELAIMNLIENGIKYSGDNPEITVKIDVQDSEIKLSISDRGPGIAGKDLKHIFDRFYTVDKARSRKMGGAGLGLSIVRSIVERHDGEITATSLQGEGATFTLSFPVKMPSSLSRAP
ncbi:MAG: ATP-binding protein [Simkaniaceae bacterium]|nr:ATP-binding protein [Simkaniaceae bacterium]